jgi:hypothetical protein
MRRITSLGLILNQLPKVPRQETLHSITKRFSDNSATIISPGMIVLVGSPGKRGPDS